MRWTRLPLRWLLCLALAGCDGADLERNRLAASCMRASDDNRVKLSSSLLSEAEVHETGDLVEVRTRVPVGIGLDARIKWRAWEYRCRRDGDRMIFLGYRTYTPER